MKSLSASRPEDFAAMLDYVHDRSYDLHRLELDQERNELRIPIQFDQKKGEKRLEGLLIVKNADAFSVHDDAEIEEGDINTIEYASPFVIIKGAIPVDLRIEVSTLNIELLLPDDAPLA
jgi:hypothetical protein